MHPWDEGFDSPAQGWLLQEVLQGPRPHCGVSHPLGTNPQFPKPATESPVWVPSSSPQLLKVQGGKSTEAAPAVTQGQPWGVGGVGTSLSRSRHAGTGESSALLALARGHGEGRSSLPLPPSTGAFQHEK